jgi:hypothetical protein
MRDGERRERPCRHMSLRLQARSVTARRVYQLRHTRVASQSMSWPRPSARADTFWAARYATAPIMPTQIRLTTTMRESVHAVMGGRSHSPWTAPTLLPQRGISAGELLDPRRGAGEPVAVEEERRSVRDPVLRPVELG